MAETINIEHSRRVSKGDTIYFSEFQVLENLLIGQRNLQAKET